MVEGKFQTRMSNPTALVQKLWNHCNILRDDGLSYGDLALEAAMEQFATIAEDLKK